MTENDYQELFLFAQIKLSGLIQGKSPSHFKTGKTVQELKDRFNENYNREYDDILELASSSDGAAIDRLESEMIAKYVGRYSHSCDNTQIGGGLNCEDELPIGGTAYLYVVYKA